MGSRTRLVRRWAIKLIEKYGLIFKPSFEENKKLVEKLADIPSKKLRNKIAGYITKLVKTGRAEEIWLLRRKQSSL